MSVYPFYISADADGRRSEIIKVAHVEQMVV